MKVGEIFKRLFIKDIYRIMEKKTREELALMGKEELEAVVLHLQDEVDELEASLTASREMKNLFYNKMRAMEVRVEILMQLLKSWGVE